MYVCMYVCVCGGGVYRCVGGTTRPRLNRPPYLLYVEICGVCPESGLSIEASHKVTPIAKFLSMYNLGRPP